MTGGPPYPPFSSPSEPPTPPERQRWRRPRRDDPAYAPWGLFEIFSGLLAAVVLLAVMFVAVTIVVAVADLPARNTENTRGGALLLVVAQVCFDVAVVAIAAWLSIGRYHLSPRAWGLRPPRLVAPGRSALVLVVSFMALFLYQVVTAALGLSDLEPQSNVPQGLFGDRLVVPFTVVLVVIVAPLAEEMFFRGFICGGLRPLLGDVGAAAASGVLFALIHFNGPKTVGLILPFSVIGFMFGMLFATTGSLWNTILVHFSFNLVGVLSELAGPAGTLTAIAALVGLFLLLTIVAGNGSGSAGRRHSAMDGA